MLPIEKCLAMNSFVYDEFKKGIRPGVTEGELKRIFLEAIAKGPYSSRGYEYNLMAGARTALIGEKEESDNRVCIGDAIIFDLMIEVDGFWSDTTRVFFCGQPPAEAVAMYNAVQQVLQNVSDFVVPGRTGREIWDHTAKRFKELGYGGMFPHHAGHQIGHEICIPPDFLPDCIGVVEEGMTITLEPGIYKKEFAGIRLENDYLVTKDGLVNLTLYPTDINYFIIPDSD